MYLKWIWKARFILIPGFALGLASLLVLTYLCASTPASLNFPYGFSLKSAPASQPVENKAERIAAASAPVAALTVDPKPSLPPLKVRQRNYWPLVRDEARNNGLDPAMVMALVQTESSFNPYAVSNKGAVGLMQINPPTADHLGLENPLDPKANIKAGIRYLAWLNKLFKGDTVMVLAAYNAGPTKVLEIGRVPDHKETHNFIIKVMGRTDSFRQRFMTLARK